MALLVAVAHLILLRGLDVRIILLFGLPPAFAALSTTRDATKGQRRLAWSFLAAIGIGATISRFPALFPKLGAGWVPHGLPQEYDRLLAWYAAVYVAFVMGVLPVFVFARALCKRRKGEPADLSPFTCYLGLFTMTLVWVAFPGVLALLGFWPLF